MVNKEKKEGRQSARRQEGPGSIDPRYIWAKFWVCDTPAPTQSMSTVALW